jgi:hypothetical protein
VSFFYLTALLQFLQHSGQVAPPAMPQFHAMRNLANAGRLGECCQMREQHFGRNFGRHGFFARLV